MNIVDKLKTTVKRIVKGQLIEKFKKKKTHDTQNNENNNKT